MFLARSNRFTSLLPERGPTPSSRVGVRQSGALRKTLRPLKFRGMSGDCLTRRWLQRPLEQDQVVAVNQLGLVDIAEQLRDLGGGFSHDALSFGGAVVDEPARNFTSVGVATRHHFAALERAAARNDPNRQQALS